jgi:hypothetical protein
MLAIALAEWSRPTEAPLHSENTLPWVPHDQTITIAQFGANTIEHVFGLVDCRLIVIGGNHHCGGNLPVLGIINVEAIFVHPRSPQSSHLANDSNRGVVSVTERRFPPPWSVDQAPSTRRRYSSHFIGNARSG